jgi:hypothetical protein
MNKDQLLQIVSEISGVPAELILQKNRKRKFLIPRQIYSYLLRKKLKLTLHQIGEILGSDHTTVIHSVQKVEELLEIQDDLLCNLYYDIEQQVHITFREPLRFIITFPMGKLLQNELSEIEERYGCKVERFSQMV